MAVYSAKLQVLLAPVVESMGFELVGVEHHRGTRSAVVRVYVDRPDGINVDDCAAVSHQISGVLDVEDPISGHYTLEVSSPGLDRPLFVPEHYDRFRGRRAKLKLNRPLAGGGRKLVGEIRGVSADAVVMQVEDGDCSVPFEQIDSARLVPQY